MLVSVIIPVYNVEKYIEKCIESVLEQTFGDFEIIVVIDGSTDGSEAIARRLQEENPGKITVINQENKGLGGARNTGIINARGKYLLFVDSDDYIEKELLADATKIIESENSDIVFFDFNYVDENGAFLECGKAIPTGNSEFSAMPEALTAWPCAWNKLYKKELFTENDIFYPDRLWFEDLATTPRLLCETNKISYIEKPYYNYVQRSDSIMADSKKNASRILRNKEILTAYELSENYFLQKGKHRQYYPELEYLAVYHILFTAAMRALIGIGFGNDRLSAVRAVPDGDPVPPPELTGNAPIFDAFHPVVINFGKPFGREMDLVAHHRVDGGFCKRSHFYEPLFGNDGLDRAVAAVAMPHVVRVRLDLDERAAGFEVFHDLFARGEAIHTLVRLARVRVHRAVVVHHADDFQIMAKPYLEVVGVVRGRDLDRAGTNSMST